MSKEAKKSRLDKTGFNKTCWAILHTNETCYAGLGKMTFANLTSKNGLQTGFSRRPRLATSLFAGRRLLEDKSVR